MDPKEAADLIHNLTIFRRDLEALINSDQWALLSPRRRLLFRQTLIDIDLVQLCISAGLGMAEGYYKLNRAVALRGGEYARHK